MGGLALSVQPRNAILRTGEHGINLCLLGRAVKRKKKQKNARDASRGHLIHIAVSLSPSLFLIHTDPWRLILGDSYTCPSHTFSLSPTHTTLRTTICPPPQSACGQTQNNNVISPLKGTRAAFIFFFFLFSFFFFASLSSSWGLHVILGIQMSGGIKPAQADRIALPLGFCWYSNKK